MLIAENISFSFGSRSIIDRANFELAPSTISCLLGGNGSGKTTILNLITGFLRPATGNIRWKGKHVVGLRPFQIARLGIGRTFQSQRLISSMSVEENILFALQSPKDERLRAVLKTQNSPSKSSTRCKARELMFLYFLADIAGHTASQISHGQQKLLTLACCEARDPDLLLLDEPAAGISPEFRKQIAERVLDLKAKGKAVLLIEHQADFLQSVGDRYFFLDSGRLNTFETFAEVWQSTTAPELVD